MRVAFITLNAYDMLSGEGDTVGGAQLQQVLIGKALAERGHDIVFIENDAEHKTREEVDGVRIVTRPSRDGGNVASRAILRTTDLLGILRRVDPDTCYVRMPLFALLPTATYCTLTKTRLVYGFAHDSELTSDPVIFESKFTDNAFYRGLIRLARSKADALVAQNDYQERTARERYDMDVVQIPNGYKPRADPGPYPFHDDRPVVLWVATLRPMKQPTVMIELADRIPHALFVIVGPPADEAPELYDEVKEASESRDNVRFEGFVPYDEVDAYFAAADIFCNTSTGEGFPNTFLQAWAYGTPVASLNVNPNEALTAGNGGFYADSDLDQLSARLSRVLTKEGADELSGLSEGVEAYFEAEYGIDQLADAYEEVFISARK